MSTAAETPATLVADDVHITYRTYLDAQPGLRTRLKRGYRATAPRFHDVHAVRGVSLTLHEGESLGIIGSNGSGKSTLLAGLAGLLDVQAGTILATSRPALLGVGAALDTRLSGRRNIKMGCMALGLSKAEIAERVDEIIEFTGLHDSIDLPMKTYSSGMKARLTFTVATVVTPEILLIDEALAVGDRSFRARATQRLGEIRDAAGSVIVVSHNLGEIRQMCSRVAWLEKGVLLADGDPEQVIGEYQDANPDPAKKKPAKKKPAKKKPAKKKAAEKSPAKKAAEKKPAVESTEAATTSTGEIGKTAADPSITNGQA